MKIKTTALSALLFMGVSATAMADFSGLYVGPQISYTWANTSWQGQDGAELGTYPDGFSVGPHVGWAYQMDQWVFALEGSYSGGSFSDQVAYDSDTYKTKLSQVFTVTPLVGYAMDEWLFYGKAGYESAKVTVDANTADVGSFSSDERQSGWTAGLGVSYKITDTNSIGLEYDYARLGSTSLNGTSSEGDAVGVDVNSINVNSVSLVYSHYFW